MLGINNLIFCQGDTTVLGMFQVIDSLEKEKKNMTSYSFDSIQYAVSNGIDGGEFINKNTGIYVKDYGPGTTTTLSYRGNSASHTKIYWEGISVDNVMLGLSDLSLISFNNVVNMNFLKAGNSLSLGSGGFGGILNVTTGNDKWTGISADIGFSYGSFNTKIVPVNIFVGNGKWKFELYVIESSSDNNYEYTNYLEDDEKAVMKNNAFSKMQLMPKLSYKANQYNQLSLSYWYTESYRQVPSVIGTSDGDATQIDLWNRGMIQWQYQKGKIEFEFKSSIINDEMYYDNKVLGIDSDNEILSSKNRIQLKINLPTHLISETQLKFDVIQVKTNNYEAVKQRNEISIYEALSFQKKYMYAKAGVRVESPAADKIYFMPSLNVGFVPIKDISSLWLFGSAAYNVRYPTFNEMYWRNAGNPNLKEESSKSAEIGIEQKFKKNRYWEMSVLFNVYYSEIHNFIAWAPNNSSIWIPQNIKEVENSGLEIESKLNWKKGKWTAFLQAGYTYTSSLINENVEYPEFNGNQQIYIPPHKIQGTFNISWKTIFMSYNQVYTDNVFISADNKIYLPYSAPASLELGKKFPFKESMISASFKISNLYDEEYQYVAHRPMPLRNYLFNLLYHFN